MRVCLDVGHLTLSGGNAVDFLDEYWQLIGEIHLHDALAYGAGGPGVRDHLALGRGAVDYVQLLDRLREEGYDKVVILEVNTVPDLVESLERVKPWL
jgi:sugar phosphate isomerase/epimerase